MKERNLFQNKKNILFFILILSGLFWSCLKSGLAEEQTSLDMSEEEQEKIEKKNEEIQKLEEKAQTYEKMLLLKQKQKTLLGGQIENLNNEINVLKSEIKNNAEKIDSLNAEIDELRINLVKNEILIEAQKEILADMIRNYQEDNDDAISKIVFGIETFSSIATKNDHISQTGDRIVEITVDLKNLQKKITQEQAEIIKKRDEVVRARQDLEEKNTRLASTRSQKNTLLIQTEGDEAKYQEKLEKIEKQKQELLGDIDELYNANFAEISAFASGLERPTSGLAETSWYYSQKDPRWGDETIGNSKSKMKDFGCAVSSVAMVFTFKGERINPKQLSDRPIFSWDLINWPTSWNDLRLASSTAHSGVNWSTVDKELSAGNPVIVFINARSGAGHYVVVHHKADNGKYVVHDPYWGANIYLDSSIELLSKLYKVSISKRSINQMIIYK